jgi:hypothetical protein
MHIRIVRTLLAVVLAGCAGTGNSPAAKEIPLTKEQLVANHTNTVLTYQLSDGGSGKNVFDSDGGMRGTYIGKTGPEADIGRYAWEKGNVDCIFWKSGERVAGPSSRWERTSMWPTSKEVRSARRSIRCSPSSSRHRIDAR